MEKPWLLEKSWERGWRSEKSWEKVWEGSCIGTALRGEYGEVWCFWKSFVGMECGIHVESKKEILGEVIVWQAFEKSSVGGV